METHAPVWDSLSQYEQSKYIDGLDTDLRAGHSIDLTELKALPFDEQETLASRLLRFAGSVKRAKDFPTSIWEWAVETVGDDAIYLVFRRTAYLNPRELREAYFRGFREWVESYEASRGVKLTPAMWKEYVSRENFPQ